jgi:sulfur carrier protein ThiS
MKVTVFLYGTFRQRFKNYQHHKGFDVELPKRASAKDLLSTLGISAKSGAVVIQNGRVLKTNETVQEGTSFNIMQSIHGG